MLRIDRAAHTVGAAVPVQRGGSQMTISKSLIRLSLVAFALALPMHATAQPQWKVVKPSNTGVMGDEVRVARFAPDGRLWVGARWTFWGEGGISIYDFTTKLWETHSNWDGSGFPSAFPNDIEFAADGTVWIATRDGLVHYVNGQWEVFTSANTPMPYHDVRAIDLDSQGRVWINVRRGSPSSDNSVFVYDGATWQSWSVGAGIPWPLPWKRLNGMLVDSNDHVWVGNTTQSGLAEFDGTTWTIRTGPGVPSLKGPFEDAFGDKWAIAENFGSTFYRFDGSTWETFSSGNTPFVQTTTTAMANDDQGRLLVSNWFGQVIRQVSPGSSTFEEIANIGVRAYNLNPRPNGDVWMTSPAAVRHLDASGTQIKAFNSWNTGLPDYFVDRFSLDRNGNLWVASGQGGLSRFDGQRWRNWGDHNAGSEPYPFAGNEPMGGFYLDRAGVGWMGGNGIARWDPATGQSTGFWNWQNTPAIGVTLVTHFAEDMNGTIFAATYEGYILRFDGSTWTSEPPTAGRFTTTYAGIQSDSAGNVYAAGLWDINIWDGNAWSTLPLPNPKYFFNLRDITAFAIGPDDTLWIGTGKGLVRYANGQFTEFNTANSPLPAMVVVGVDVRPDGVVGLSSHEPDAPAPFPSGVSVIDGDPANAANWSIYQYGSSPIPHYQLGPVKFDAQGNLWISAISEGCAVLLNDQPTCYADCDQSTGAGTLDIFDFLCFQNSFVAGEPYACDCDTSTGPLVCDVFDFLCFQDSFVGGCP
jgi:ligand-binding sensor domain-containing protein